MGRPGEAIAIPDATGAGRINVVFDPSTGALLFWSQSEGDDFERHTVVRSSQVARIGDRWRNPGADRGR